MKNVTLFILFSLVAAVTVSAQKSSALIVHQRSGDSALTRSMSVNLENSLVSDLKKEFPCLEVTTQDKIHAKLNQLRQMALLGSEANYTIEDVGKSFNYDYMFSINTTQAAGDLFRIEIRCYKKKEVYSFEWANVNTSPDSYPADCEQLSTSLMERLKRFELCAFRGNVTLTIETERDTTVKASYMVYCDGMDRQFSSEEVTQSRTKTIWTLKKTNTEHAEGDVSIFMYEEKSYEEDNPCYRCQSGREGGRTYKNKSTFNVDSEGISTESIFEGKPHADARIKLYFEENSTYNITVNATSKTFTDDESWEMEAVGTCDNIPRESTTKNREEDVFTNQTFYSFPGKSTDLYLIQNDTKSWIDPVTHERTTITIDFNLSKE